MRWLRDTMLSWLSTTRPAYLERLSDAIENKADFATVGGPLRSEATCLAPSDSFQCLAVVNIVARTIKPVGQGGRRRMLSPTEHQPDKHVKLMVEQAGNISRGKA